MFAKIVVDYYGTPTPVNQLASFNVPEPRMAIIAPYDKGSLTAIEKALRDSDLGVNPTSDGVIIRVVFPQLTEERRRDLIKVARTKAEDSRISIRNIRRHAKETLDRLSKDGEVGEDDAGRAEKELEKLTHRHVELVDDALRVKESELLEV
jgi:ribosome recycling factor